MAIDFPNSPRPESGDVYTAPNGVSYTFDGIKWIGQEQSSVGGAGLPDQTGQAGKFLTTDGSGNASWADAEGPKGDTGDQGDVGPPGEQGEQGVPGVDALWNWSGAYSASPQYQEGDIVTYEGGTYRRNNFSNSAMGFIPTNTTYWEYVAEKGEQGVRGGQGEPGAEGQQGSQGVPGQTGGQGTPGQKGDQGEPGNEGAQGATGSPGARGADGAKGDPGETGPPGQKGDQGVPGNDSTVQGPPGDTGAQGVSVTLQGTKATIADLPLTGLAGQGWIVTTGDGLTHLNGSLWFWNVADGAWNDIGPIVGPQGDKGNPGDQGDKGDQGVPGNDGAPGAAGDKGDTGETGPPGDPGLPGSNGAKGDQGLPGEPGQQGEQGPPGQQGEQGVPGIPGQGVSTGGIFGQVLAKLSGDDYDTGWVDQLDNIDRLTASDKQLVLGTNGVLTFPNGLLKIAGNKIRNVNESVGLIAGSEIEVTVAKTVISNGLTDTDGLSNQHIFEVGSTRILSAYQVVNSLDEGGPSLTSEQLTELTTTGFKIGLRVTNDLGDGPPLIAFNGWTFGTVDQQLALTFPDDTVQTTAWTGLSATVGVSAPDNQEGALWYNSTDGRTYVKYGELWVDANPPVVPHVSTYLDGLVVEGTGITTAEIDADVTVQDITFTANGRIRLPLGGDIVDSFDRSLLGGPSDRLVKGDNTVVLGADGALTIPGAINSPYGIEMTTDRGTVQFGHNLELPGVATHFHINKLGSFDLFFGDDSNYVKLPYNDGVEIGANGNVWRFGTDGSLTLPEVSRIIRDEGGVSFINFLGAPGGLTLGTSGLDSVSIIVNDDGQGEALKKWEFKTNGGLQFPDGTIQNTAYSSIYPYTVSATPPEANNLWFNIVDGRMYVNIYDEGTLWVDANPPVVPPVSTYLSGLTIDEQTISSVDHASPDVKIAGNLLPDQDLTYDLGSPTNQWNSLHIKDTTIYMSGRAVSLTSEGLKVDGGAAISVLDGGVASTWLMPV
jgi:hypothetical protein